MKKLYFLPLIVLISVTHAFSQNIFYDAQNISILVKSTQDSLNQDALAKIVLPYFISNGVLNEDDLKLMGTDVHDKLTKYLDGKAQNEEKLRDFAKKQDTVLKTAFDKVDLLKGEVVKIHEKYAGMPGFTKGLLAKNIGSQFNNPTLKDSLIAIRDALAGPSSDSLQQKVAKRISENINLRSFLPEQVLEDIEVLNTKIKEVNEHRKAIAERIKLVRDDFIKYLNGSIAVQKVRTNKTIAQFNQPIIPADSKMSANIGGTAALSNFRLPTEAEMIDALAVYMAKRFKQEVALSFVFVIKKEIDKRELIRDMFPNTIDVFARGEIYEMPKLGSVWHHALAEDIAKMPLNLRHSNFIRQSVKDTSESSYYSLFHDLVGIGEMARNRNSLPDMVILYKSGTEPIRNKFIRTTFEVLNMVNNELTTDNDSTEKNRFWLNWQRFNDLSPLEWEYFLKLLHLRYKDQVFSNDRLGSLLNATSQKQQEFKNYLMKTLLVLNSFETSQTEYLENIKKDPKSIFTGVSFWDMQQDIFSILIDNKFIRLPESASRSLSVVKQGISMYRLMEKKDYAAMIHESIAMAENLFPKHTSRLDEMLVKAWKLDKSKFQKVQVNVESTLVKVNEFYVALNRAEPAGKKQILEKTLIEMTENALKIYNGSDYASYINGDKTVKQKIIEDFRKKNSEWTLEGKTDKELIKRISNTYFNALVDQEVSRRLLTAKSPEALEKIIFKAYGTENLRWAIPVWNSNPKLKAVLKTAEFFTDVMSAQGSKELSSVIEAHAMPANSYKIKRNSRYSVDLNSYVGFYGGAEILDEKRSPEISKLAANWGLSAPVGITLSWGSRAKSIETKPASFFNRFGDAKSLMGNSFSAGLTLIDIAAAVSFRISNDGEEALPKALKWSQLLSPGAHVRWGIKNTPLCMSFGVQYTPQLRNFTEAVSNQQAYRYYGGLFFDLPLYNVYRR